MLKRIAAAVTRTRNGVCVATTSERRAQYKDSRDTGMCQDYERQERQLKRGSKAESGELE
jgi:hypothetical protein